MNSDARMNTSFNPTNLLQYFSLLSIILLFSCQQENTDELSGRQAFLTQRTQVLESFEPCSRDATTAIASLVAESLCTVFTVPENYDDPESRQVALKVMVIPSLSDLVEPDPLVLLAGGPGQAATDLVQVAQIFTRTRTERDIVLVDQRGTGELSPFDCQLSEEESEALILSDPPVEEVLAIQMQVLEDCLATMDANAEFYTTDIALRDLDAIRQWLGYSSFNLWGASYGSRAALAYLQAYPESTRTVIIDAIAPVQISLPLYSDRDASASMAAVFADCASEEHCNAAYPDLENRYLELLEKLETPQPFRIRDDKDFSVIEGSLTSMEFQSLLRQVLYSREAQRLIPFIIDQAWQENYDPMLALAGQYSEALINQGMFLSVICNEDATLHEGATIEALSETDFLLESAIFNTFVLDACAIWPKREIPASYFEPVDVDKPVLIFSGTLDPITPPVWGELVDDNLPNSMHLIVEGFGHGTLSSQCAATLMYNFIETGSLGELETDCINSFGRRPFFVTPGGSVLPND